MNTTTGHLINRSYLLQFFVLTLALSVTLCSRADAQAVAYYAGTPKSALSTAFDTKSYASLLSELQRPVSVDLHDVTLDEAIRTIAAEAQLGVAYGTELLNREKRITIRLERVPVSEALDHVLAGTELATYLTRWREIVVVPKEPAVEPPPARVRMVGVVTGTVTDAQSGEPLPGATVAIKGTTRGAASDLEGNYRITNAPLGEQTLVASYVGYEAREFDIVVLDGETTVQDVTLAMVIVEGEEVVVTAQLGGQARAINQQLTSEQIVNIVSSDRIRELPDANAAESVARLPGVALQRNAGEGSKLNIRGLSPRFTNITVNGQKIPATGDDRSVDLSMISQDVLESIELYKALTPDQDADATGGSVNFVIRRAPEGLRGRLDVLGGFNSLSNELGDYKLSASVSNRLLSNRLGVLATGTVHRADRGRDMLNVNYRAEGIDQSTGGLLLNVTTFNLIDQIETRDRYTASLGLDYELSQRHQIRTNSFFSRTDRDIIARRKQYAPSFGQVQYGLNDEERELFLWSNMISGSHVLGRLETEWTVAQASTIDLMPFQTGLTFEENAPFTGDLVTDEGPFPLPDAAKNNLAQTRLVGGGNMAETRGVERDLTANIDFRLPFSMGRQLGGYVKIGGKHADKKRRFRRQDFIRPNSTGFLLLRDNPGAYQVYNGAPTVTNFMDESFDPGDFMNGRFDFNARLRADAAREIFETYEDSLALPTRFATLNDYDAGETVSAGYAMTRLDLGPRIMLLGGLRYEWTETDYEARFTNNISGQFGQQGQVVDTTGGQNYGEWLPMVHLKVDVTDMLSVRLAATRTLARPLYRNLSPGGRINFGGFAGSITQGNPDLKHTTAWNYDATVALFTGRFGLLSVSSFYKRLENIDYRANLVVTDPESRYFGFDLDTPRNAEGITTVYGFESEIQTNLRFLPSPFDGIILNANYTRTFGETVFPFLEIETGPPPFYRQNYIDGEREGRLPGQSDHIANLSLGYEKRGFSGRVSMVYQSEFLSTVGKTEDGDAYFDDFVRFDATLTQRIFGNATVYLSGTNISGLTERSIQGGRSIFLREEEDYGSTYSLGFRYLFE